MTYCLVTSQTNSHLGLQDLGEQYDNAKDALVDHTVTELLEDGVSGDLKLNEIVGELACNSEFHDFMFKALAEYIESKSDWIDREMG